jgi:bifunctional DNase/RNase
LEGKENKFIKMSLEGVRIEFPSQKPIILLKEEKGSRYLPIWIGAFEASAIALEISNIKTPRPMTHDLFMNFLMMLGVKIKKIEVTDIKDNTFYAMVHITSQNKDSLEIDSRPSDAIALAVRQKCPIFAKESVLESAGLMIQSIEEEVEKFKDFLEGVDPNDFKNR